MHASHRFHRSNLLKAATAATILVGTILVGTVVGTVPVNAAGARVCPQFIAKYCVYDRSKRIFTADTNPCFAKLRHWTVIYMGACRFAR